MELVGVGVSPGIAVGRALVVQRDTIPVFRITHPPEDADQEIGRLGRAVSASREQLLAIKERLSREVGVPHAYIFEAHLLMLEDPLLLDRTVDIIRTDHVNAEWALRTVAEDLHALFEKLPDAYVRERRSDLDDVIGRILLNLRGAPDAPSLARLPRSFVLVASDLAPSEAVELDWDRVLAVVTDAGSSTYHTAIIARSLGIPAVAGLGDATRRLPPGALLAVDGTRGIVVSEPSDARLAEFRLAQEHAREQDRQLEGTRSLPAVTTDGVEVALMANAEFPEEAATAWSYGALGIGLFRSEYLLGRTRQWPSEDEQVDVYRRLVEQFRPSVVTVRTWDVGGEDLAVGSDDASSGPNPALGERALRLARKNREPFVAQIRALLRASVHGPIRIMFPFTAGPSDVRLALSLVEEARDDLRRRDIDFSADVPIGLTIEVPSAAATIDLLPDEIEFLSVGTNDLIQYLLAVDRRDPRVASLYQPLHPAVLRTIHSIVEASAARDLPVSLCGEMASQPLEALALLGLGVRRLSMTAAAIPHVKAAIRAARADVVERVAHACLGLGSGEEIEATLREGFAPFLERVLAQ